MGVVKNDTGNVTVLQQELKDLKEKVRSQENRAL